ncbi:hypothetical protein [Chitinophaga sancti]|uniref:Uncharacterized protein n=1 Tax=Chitinophaga sancti TaxID=1004 RepID=A0A1K1LZG4_9BACT|nr:hypothetical protein [Chitinophaga sancti]WQD64734.1 hypothetical protein U0033_10035 [Chitinophaga sancti]WQG89644.1 hypothetical protein SR876_32440 [Chitinophaga sancti]SFW16265.1 hypothetical protein SAMN05661012_00336 [Chitinophaga sancti]
MARLKKGEIRPKEKMQQDALAAYEACGNITEACKKSKIARRTFYNWLDESKPDNKYFIDGFKAVSKMAIGVLEDEANRRAVKGVKKGIYYKGKRVAWVQEYSDTLLIVLLKAHAPEKYKDRTSNEHSGPNGGPIPTEVTHRVIFEDNGE